MTDSPEPGPQKYAWPKYVLAALALFLTVCIVWTVKEVNRLKRAKEDGREMRPSLQTTN